MTTTTYTVSLRLLPCREHRRFLPRMSQPIGSLTTFTVSCIWFLIVSFVATESALLQRGIYRDIFLH
jgi:hypothetical protein